MNGLAQTVLLVLEACPIIGGHWIKQTNKQMDVYNLQRFKCYIFSLWCQNGLRLFFVLLTLVLNLIVLRFCHIWLPIGCGLCL